jgi:hypothetical protein
MSLLIISQWKKSNLYLIQQEELQSMNSVITVDDQLKLTPQGRQASLNADLGGFFIAPKSFALGSYDGEYLESIPQDLVTPNFYSGRVHYVEVVSEKTVKFTLDIPASVGSVDGILCGEIAVYLEDGTTLAHAILSSGYLKRKGIGVRIEILLHLLETSSSVINVTMSELGSIPSVSSVEDLPNPILSVSNALSVLTLMSNSDGSSSPGIVCKYGAGGQHWGFYGFDRLFSGKVGSGNAVSPAEFLQGSLIVDRDLVEGDLFLVQVVSGLSAGETRRFLLSGSLGTSRFTAIERPFSHLDDNSIISIWSKYEGSSNQDPWRSQGDIPKDWILTKGDSVYPIWAPPFKNEAVAITLYKEPSKLNLSPLTIVGTSSEKTYPLGNLFPESNNFALVSTQGINQHRGSFDLISNRLEFSQNLPNQIILDLRIFTRSPSSGTKLMWHSAEFTGNGSNREYVLPSAIDTVELMLVIVDHVQQALTSYVLDKENGLLVFTESPPAGSTVEINTIEYKQEEGFSTDIVSQQFRTTDITNTVILPVYPENKSQVFVSEQGFWVNKSQYEVVNNKVVFKGSIEPLIDIEVLVFINTKTEGVATADVKGMVTDVVSTAKGTEFIRHNSPNIKVPHSKFNLSGSGGIEVVGDFPDYEIRGATPKEQKKDNFESFNVQSVETDSEQVIITKRIEFKGDIIIQATADFSIQLGPGFISTTGYERGQFVLGFKNTKNAETDYGRGVKGTGEFGISGVSKTNADVIGYGNSSVTQSWNIVKNNHPSGFIDVVAKMRIVDADVSKYGSNLTALLNILVIPKL